jgi:methionine-S-sulfoxide reductase
MQSIVLGGGCFWCVEAVFKRVKGVERATSGYAGGKKESRNPSYEEVASKKTGHAEVVKVEFDEKKISLEEVLKIFFTTHNPTEINKQGNDVGSQYRSIILYNDESQKEISEKIKQNMQKLFNEKIATEIKKLGEFYPAEKYHRNFYDLNPAQPYCMLVIDPKIKKLKEEHKKYFKAPPSY